MRPRLPRWPLALALAGGCSTPAAPDVRLVGHAVLPAETFSTGPRSAAALGPVPIHGVEVPLRTQPVQGISGVVRNPSGELLAVLDNGYGTRENSPDFLLRLQPMTPAFRTAEGGSGEVRLGTPVQLADPHGYMPYPIVEEGTVARRLTGADLDPESIQRDEDGTLWIGDEFGPFLLHVHPQGALLEPPIPLVDARTGDVVRAPQTAGGGPARVKPSGGLEGLARTPSGRLLAMLEKPLAGDPEGELLILEFDPRAGAFTGLWWRYPLDPLADAIGDFQMVDETRGYVIERDSAQGSEARLKRIYEVELRDRGRLSRKKLVADLLAIPNGAGLGGPGAPGDHGLGDPFAFPFLTIESLWVLEDGRLLVGNDNNFPFSVGRHLGVDRPDDTEFLLLERRSPLVPPR